MQSYIFKLFCTRNEEWWHEREDIESIYFLPPVALLPCLWKGQRFTRRSRTAALFAKYPVNPWGVRAGGKSSAGIANGRIILSIFSSVRYDPASWSISGLIIGRVCSCRSKAASLSHSSLCRSNKKQKRYCMLLEDQCRNHGQKRRGSSYNGDGLNVSEETLLYLKRG